MNCTWKDCTAAASHPQLDGNGREWANLCCAHHAELEVALDSMDAKKLLRAWACAKSEESKKRDVEAISRGVGLLLKHFGEK